MWWTTGVAYDTAKIEEDAHLAGRRSGTRAGRARWRCWTTPRGVRGGPHPARLSASTRPTTPSSTQALALLEEQKPLLRTYTTDDIGVLSSGDVWVMHAWGADVYQVQEERDTVVYYIPEEGGVRGSDTMVLLPGAKHPIAAHLFINFMLDAEVARREHQLHRLHGPQRGRQAVHRPGDPRGPDGEPGPGRWSTSSQEILDLGRRRDEVHRRAGPKLRSGG